MDAAVAGQHVHLELPDTARRAIALGRGPAGVPDASRRCSDAGGILAGAGYATVSIATNNYNMDPFNLMQGFERRHQKGATADWVVDTAIETVTSHLGTEEPAGRRPLFLYLHLMDVHAQGRSPPPSYPAMFPSSDSELSRYYGAIRFVDEQIGRFVSYLQAVDAYEDTLLVVVSDHGEEFGDHVEVGRRLGLHAQQGSNVYGVGHGHTLFPELIEVPLIFHGAGIRSGRIGQQVRLLDLALTILALVGASHPEFEPVGIDVIGSWYRGPSKI